MSDPDGNPNTERWLAAAAATLAFLVFAPSLTGGFLYDDKFLVLGEGRVHALARWSEWFTKPYWAVMVNQGLWRPLVTASYGLTWALVGPQPLLYHITNLLLHSLATWLVWLTARRLGLSAAASLLAALMFAVHPVHGEVAMCTVYRTDSMATAAILGVLAVHLGAPGCARPLLWREVGLMVLLGASALLAKESSMLMIFLLAAAQVGFRPRPFDRRTWTLAVLLIALTCVFVVLKIRVTGQFGIPPMTEAYPGATPRERLSLAPLIIVEYARLLLLPARLSLDYQLSLPAPSAAPWLLAALGVFAALWLAAMILLIRARQRVLAFSLLWTTVTIGPYLHLLPIGATFADRFAYLASAGVCWFAGGLVDAFPSRRRLLTGAVIALALIGGLRSFSRALLFRDSLRLWEATVAASPESGRAWFNLGHEYRDRGDLVSATEAFRRAFAISPENRFARSSFARCLAATGDPVRGEGLLREGLRLNPGEPGLSSELAEMLVGLGRAEEALPIIEGAVQAQPDFPRLWFNLAVTRAANGDRGGAAEALERARTLGYHDQQRMQMLAESLGR